MMQSREQWRQPSVGSWTWRNALIVILFVGLHWGPIACKHQTDVSTHMLKAELLVQIRAGQTPTILDVRTQREYDNGHVPGAIRVPFYAVSQNLKKVPAAPQEPVVVYCTHGLRAGIARFALHRAGFKRVVYLEGHMLGWRRAKLPIERSQKKEVTSDPSSP